MWVAAHRSQVVHTGASVSLKMLKTPECPVTVDAGEDSFGLGRLHVNMVREAQRGGSIEEADEVQPGMS